MASRGSECSAGSLCRFEAAVALLWREERMWGGAGGGGGVALMAGEAQPAVGG